MKRLILAMMLLVGVNFLVEAEEAVGGTPAATGETPMLPKSDLKIKVRWTEKKAKDGKRLVTVLVKNEGMADLKDVPAEIILKGKGEKERQTEKITLNVPRNQEKGFEVVVKADSGFRPMAIEGQNQPAFDIPVKEIASVEIVMGEMVVASK